MLVLAGVDEVQYSIGTQLLVTVFGAGDVGGGVEITAVLLADDDTHGVTVLVLVLVQIDDDGAFIFYRQPFLLQIGDDGGQHGVVHALAHHVGRGQRHVESVVNLLVMQQGNVDQLLPHGQTIGVATLQLHHVAPGTLGKVRIRVILLLGLAIELFQIRQAGRQHVRIFLFQLFQVGDQHAELGTPVADVVGPNHLVAEKFQGTHHGIADDGGAQVTYVHFLGHVGGRVIHHHGLRLFHRRYVGAFVGDHGVYLACQPVAVEEEVDKAGAGQLGLGHQLGSGQVVDQQLGQGAGVLSGGLGQQ